MYVSFIRTTGRSICNVREYVALPRHKRGGSCVINLDYRRKPHSVMGREPEAECLGWAVRCYKLYSRISDVEKQRVFIRDLSCTRGLYRASYWEQMAAETVQMPAEVRQTGDFSLKHFKQLEKLNDFPIAVYNLEQAEEDGSSSISCLLDPDKQLVEGGLPICNLLMIDPSHVAFVPNFKRYMQVIFRDRRTAPR